MAYLWETVERRSSSQATPSGPSDALPSPIDRAVGAFLEEWLGANGPGFNLLDIAEFSIDTVHADHAATQKLAPELFTSCLPPEPNEWTLHYR